jgi:TonB family protein
LLLAPIALVGALAGTIAAGCAGEKSESRSDPERPRTEAGMATVTPEQNDAIDALFRRKAPALQTCWQQEYERSQNRKLEGDISLQMTVSKAGKAMGIKVVKSTIGVEAVDRCVVGEIESWTFPEGPGDAPYRRTVHLGPAF